MAPKSAAAPAETPEAADTPAEDEKVQKTFVRTLTAKEGKDTLQFVASLKKDGKYSVYATHREVDENGKLVKSSRGASSVAEDIDKAKENIEGGVKMAIKAGWVERKPGAGGGGFKPRPDSFQLSNLPKPRGK